jgi:hypothetical protein
MKQFTIQLTALLFILLWTYAAVAKLTDMDKFHGQMAQSPLILTLAAGLKWIVPSVELVLSVALMFHTTRYWAIIGSTFLIACFCWYIIAITHFSTYVPCSCGGVLEKLSWNEHLLVNFFFLILGTISLLIYKDNPLFKHKERIAIPGES